MYLSFLGYFYSWVNTAAFVGFALFCLVLGSWKREFALYLAFLELTLGSFGYLLSINAGGLNLSLRVAFFVTIMALWMWDIIKSFPTSLFQREGKTSHFGKGGMRGILISLIIFLIIWIFGIVQGYLRGHGPADIFFDANSYLYLLLFFPALAYINTEKKLLGLAKTLLFGAGISAVLTFALFITFTQSRDTALLDILYKWIRDLRIGELTSLDNGIYRIFMQSQIYLLVGFFLVAVRNLRKKIGRASLAVWGALLSAAIYISLSRSFWIGFVAGFLAIFAFMVYSKLNYKTLIKRNAEVAAVIVIGILAASLFIPRDASFLASRFRIGENALDTRIVQLAPLWSAIKTNPVFGYGFGKTLTFKSFDPRVGGRDITTYAFEWGYLDMILKFGALGLAVYLYFIWTIIWQLLKRLKEEPFYSWWAFASLAALLIVHIFTPYLNHPLGIGIIILGGAVVAGIDKKIEK